MDTSTARFDWRATLREQGRTLRWLALQTGKSPRTLYAYSRGDLVPPAEWIAAASRALGVAA
jgi:lambda repressor-like predicted transcriptional regulator